MTVTSVDICSRALIELGLGTISSFQEEGDKAQICATRYPYYAKYLISLYPWRFSLKKIKLAKLTTEPLTGYQNAFQSPSDFLVARAFFDTASKGSLPYTDYKIFGQQVFSNSNELWLDYQYFPAESEWPAYFQEFAAIATASTLAMPLTNQVGLQQQMERKAFGSAAVNGNGGLFSQARRIDAMQTPQDPISGFSLVAARFR